MADGTLTFDTKLDASGFSTGLSSIGGMASKAISVVKTAAVAIGTATVAAVVAATKVGSEFEAEISKVAAISGAAGDELEKLEEKAKKMGSTTTFTATESAQAFEYMAMAGWKTEDMLNGIDGVLNLAAASGEDLATTSDIVTDAMTALGMKTNEAAHFADILAAASSNSNTNVGMMGETFKYAAAMAGSLGYSAEDVALAVGLMANNGIKATMSGTALNAIMTRLATDTNGARAAAEDLGVAFYNEDGSAKGLKEVMDGLRKATANMTDEEKANFANKVAGVSAQKGLLAILNSSVEDYEKLSKAINSCTDAETGYSEASEMAEKMLDNLQGKVTLLVSALQGVGLSIYEELENPLKDTVGVITNIVNAMQDGFDKNGLSGLVTAGVNAIAEALNSMANDPEIPKAIEGFMRNIEYAFARIAPQLVSVGAMVITAIIDGLNNNLDNSGFLTAVTNITEKLVTTFFNNLPAIINIGISIIGAIVQGLINAIPEIVASIPQIITSIVTSVTSNGPQMLALGAFLIGKMALGLLAQAAISSLLSAATGIVGTLATGITTALPSLLSVASGIVPAIGGAIMTAVPVLLEVGAAMISAIVAGITAAIPVLIAALPVIIIGAVVALAAYFFMFTDSGKEIVKKIGEGITAANEWLGEVIRNLISWVVDFFGGFFSSFVEIGGNLINGLIEGITGVWETLTSIVSDLFGGMIENVGNFMSDIFDSVMDWCNSINAGTRDFLISVGTSISDFCSELFSKIKDFFGNIIETVNSAISNIINGIINFASNIISTIGNMISNITSTITSFISNIMSSIGAFVNNIISMITDLITNIGNALSSFIKNIIDTVKNMIENIINLVKGIYEKIVGIIKELVTNVVSAITEMGSKILQIGGDIASKAFELAKNMVSKVGDILKGFFDVGKNIVSGIWDGISSGWDWLMDKITGFGSAILDKVKDILGIHSPSKEFAKIGKFCIAGFNEGVDEMPEENSLTKHINATLSSVKANVSGAIGEAQRVSAGAQGGFQQIVNINQAISTPDELARTMRLESKYGLMKGVPIGQPS